MLIMTFLNSQKVTHIRGGSQLFRTDRQVGHNCLIKFNLGGFYLQIRFALDKQEFFVCANHSYASRYKEPVVYLNGEVLR